MVTPHYELPEVEIIRRDLDRDVGGRKIKGVEAAGMSALDHYHNRKQFTSQLVDRKVTGVARRGLHLMFGLGDGQLLVVYLGTGQFRRVGNKEQEAPHTQVVFTFTQGGPLHFVDAEGGGAMRVTNTTDLLTDVPALAVTGFDPVDEPMSWTDFGQRIRRRGGEKLRAVLTDPAFILGIGPMYADEILHSALLRYDRDPMDLTTQEMRRLYRALVETMHNAVKHRGTSPSDGGFVDLFGKPGGYEEYLEVWNRAGLRSRNGRGEVKKTRVGHGVHYYADYQV